MKTLIKNYKNYNFYHDYYYILKSFLNFVFIIFFNFKNNVIYIDFFYNDFNLVNDCFNISNINLYYDYKLNFKLMFILLYNKLLQTLI